MHIETNKPEAEEQPKLEDLIAESVGVAEAEPEEEAPEAEPDAPEQEEDGEEQEGAEPEASVEPDSAPEDAEVTKELADLGITKPESQTRFRELANQAKEGAHYRERYEQQQQVFHHLEKEGVTGEQFGLMVMIAGDVNSNEPTRLQRAHAALSQELAALSQKLGIESPGFDPLSAHPELSRKVEEGELDRATALAWAKDRSNAALATENVQRRQQQETVVRAEDQARDELTALGNELAQRDPFYDKVYEVLVPTLRPVLARLPPSEWVGATVDAYRDLRGRMQAAGQLVAPRPAAKRPDPANPGRPNGAAGGPEPKSGQDAILKMFGYSDS